MIQPINHYSKSPTLMNSIHTFQVPFQGETLHGESTFGSKGHVLMLHGGGKDRTVFYKYRDVLDSLGLGTTIFDFIGHGETGGDIHKSSLFNRTMQAEAVIASQRLVLTGCVGVSMGAYNALQLSKAMPLQSLVLMVPGVYSTAAYKIKFGPDFSAIIRKPRSWEQTDAWDITAALNGNLLVIAAEIDAIIPSEIPEKLLSSASRCSQKQLLIVPEAGHNNIWENLMLSPVLYENVRSAFKHCLSH
ncbi:alpha/beta fold hydrolase [Enterobacter sp. CP102]|uniref:alpha/beta fold hydrolase n=1 Tax=Enterobacter sp. CP102 TaxID=2976431 RepID=UPI00220E351A|nr:alpha/beta hydrolase [Enterobacter sp. CP102]UWM66203.1 alpha/beta hydrolase [Enterobacter sp. CP102]